MINYDEIDEKCREFVKYFNDIGMKTLFSCQGHDRPLDHSYEIIFDKCVSDDMIQSFIQSISQGKTHTPLVGNIMKWIRWDMGRVAENWMYVMAGDNYYENQRLALQDLETLHRMKL